MRNLFSLILSAQIAVLGLQLVAEPAMGQVLRPGDDAVISPGGRAVINPPLGPRSGGRRAATPRPMRNPDGSTTYPKGTPVPRTDGFTQSNLDGSVTIFPRSGGRAAPAPAPRRTTQPPRLNPGDDAVITPGGRTIVNPPLPAPRRTTQPPRLNPGDDAVITPGGRTIVNPPLPAPRRTTQPPRLNPGDDAVITPGGRTIVNPPLPAPPMGASNSEPRSSQPTIRRFETGSLVTPDGRRFDPLSLGTGRVRVLRAPTSR